MICEPDIEIDIFLLFPRYYLKNLLKGENVSKLRIFSFKNKRHISILETKFSVQIFRFY